MVRVPLYVYEATIGREVKLMATFRTNVKGPSKLGGHIVAPEGSRLRESPGYAHRLMVPKADRPGEFWGLLAFEALEAAQAGEHGLSWDTSEAACEIAIVDEEAT